MTIDRLDKIVLTIEQSLWPILKGALYYTVPITILSFAIGIFLATFVALAKLSNKSYLNKPASFFVWLIRGTPILVQMFLLFYGLPSVGIILAAFPTAIIIFSINQAAYSGEIIRAAITSIPQGQWKAGRSIGMSHFQILRRIILPQAARVSIPPLGNELIGLFKATSLVTLITIADLFGAAKIMAATTYEPIVVYIVAAIFYLIFCSFLSAAQSRLETKFSKFIV
jgi:cystine transport system permease protein